MSFIIDFSIILIFLLSTFTFVLFFRLLLEVQCQIKRIVLVEQDLGSKTEK